MAGSQKPLILLKLIKTIKTVECNNKITITLKYIQYGISDFAINLDCQNIINL